MDTLHVCFLWHMHQPSYLDPTRDQVTMPWVRLHGVKDYTEMAAVVADVPEARATFNFVPGLCDQLDRAADGDRKRDFFARMTLADPAQMEAPERAFLRDNFFSLQHDTMLEPWPRYRELRDLAAADRLTDADLRDLQVWFNLAWCGDTVRARPEVAALVARGSGFDEADKRALLNAHREALREVLPRYSKLAAEGRVELSCSPYYHPILPLLIDSDAARDADAQTPLPRTRFSNPADARWHVVRAVESHGDRFGARPSGMWPSEGALSPRAIATIGDAGLEWVATDEALLHRSRIEGSGPRDVHAPWRVGPLTVVFRDHELSDRIGFVYSRWATRDAVADFVERLTAIRKARGGEPGVVTVALDGENCWEHYRGGVRSFLPALYRAVARTPGLTLSTLSDAIGEVGTDGRVVRELATGSWIDGTLRTWLGDPAKNRGWELLTRTRQLVDRPLSELAADEPALADLVMRAEASDWFWWLGEGHSSAFDAEFDRVFRAHLTAIHRVLGVEPPAELDEPVDRRDDGARDDHREVDPPVAPISPRITGRRDSWLDWAGAGCVRPTQGAIHIDPLVRAMRFGSDGEALSVQLTTRRPAREDLEGLTVRLEVVEADATRGASVVVWPPKGRADDVVSACETVFEARVPWEALADGRPEVALRLRIDDAAGACLETLPQRGTVSVRVDPGRLALDHWIV